MLPRPHVLLELDGRLAHSEQHRQRDAREDRIEVANGRQVLRFTGVEVLTDPCAVAFDTAAALRARGWPGSLHRCPRCRRY
jgi:very-short-patch-repair endonuclease